MTISFRVLDAIDALGIVPRLCARHREELLRTHPDLNAWARERAALPGPQWALNAHSTDLDLHGTVVAIGGLIDKGDTGYLWFAGAMGWEKHVVAIVKGVRSLHEAALFQSLTCQVYADNPDAQRFAEYLGFRRTGVEGSFVNYGMAR